LAGFATRIQSSGHHANIDRILTERRGNIATRVWVFFPEALIAKHEDRRRPMIRFTLPAIAAVLTLSSAIPVSAQAIVLGPSVCRMPIEALDNSTPSAPAARAPAAAM